MRGAGRLPRARVERPAAGDLALVVDDPDAPVGTFTHCLPGTSTRWPAGWRGRVGSRGGRNDFGTAGWSGPCPPPGHGAHRYFFRLHALDTELGVGFRAGRRELDQALAGHVLATAALMGRYER
jgi:Raf kinase inhibitor-like YbhB/YbcL family protein